MDVAGAARAAFWAWAAAHVASCAYAAYSEETELRAEARLLMDRICTLPHGYSAGSTLLRCDEARAALSTGPLLLVVFERAGRRMMLDALAAARRELSALLRVLGLVGALGSAVLLVARAAAARLHDWRQQEKEATFSDMNREKAHAFVPIRYE